VYVPGELKSGWGRQQLEQIELARRIIERYPDRLQLALSADDVERAFRHGRIGSLLGMEGGHVLENSLGALRAYYRLGARYLTLTHNVTLDWADSAAQPSRHGGLTRFGEEVVREMNRLGMLVDLSHVSPETMDDALRVSEAPVIFSHSSARALVDVARNVPDEVLRRLPANGGVVMVTFVPSFVSTEVALASKERTRITEQRTAGVTDPVEKERIEKEVREAHPLPTATLAQVADHVEHVRRVAGVDHVGLGGDFDGIDRGPEGLEDVSRYPALLAELLRRGWSDEDVKKLAGLNVLRVMRKAEEVAHRLQAARPPSTATIEQLDGKKAE
jgi:membrane dipeptidase